MTARELITKILKDKNLDLDSPLICIDNARDVMVTYKSFTLGFDTDKVPYILLEKRVKE